MSALDQQVAEKRKELLDFATVGDGLLGRAALNKKLDALLTTHRRQVLTEIEDALKRKRANTRGEAPAYDLMIAASLVASLRDTKENDK